MSHQFVTRPEGTNTLSLLSNALGTGVGAGITQNLNNMLQQKKNAKTIQGLSPFFQQLGFDEEAISGLADSGVEPAMAANLAMSLSSLKQKQAKEQQAQQQRDRDYQRKLEHDEAERELKLRIHNEKLASKTSELGARETKEQKEKEEEHANLRQQFDRVRELIPYGGSRLIPGTKSFGAFSTNVDKSAREAYEKRQELDSLGFFVADRVFTHFNKGVISKDKLKKIETLAPNSSLSERANEGRLKSLERLANLPSTLNEIQFDEAIHKEKLKVAKTDEQGAKVEKQKLGPPPPGHQWIKSPSSGNVIPIPDAEVADALASGGERP